MNKLKEILIAGALVLIVVFLGFIALKGDNSVGAYNNQFDGVIVEKVITSSELSTSTPVAVTQYATGNFYIDNINTEKPAIQADYSWIYFTLDTPFLNDKKIIINGMFNNYSMSDDYKMDFNKKTGLYEKALLIKQGFTNYQYVLTDKNGKTDYENAIDGNHFETDNLYSVIVYYKGNNDRYHRVIGISITNSLYIQN